MPPGMRYDRTMILETERLILREIDPDRDFEPWARSMAAPQP